MSQFADYSTTWNAPVYGSLDGLLHTPNMREWPLLSMIGQLGEGRNRQVSNFIFPTSVGYERRQAAQPEVTENQTKTAPDHEGTALTQDTNVTQIFWERFGVTYEKLSNGMYMQGPTGYDPAVTNEIDLQSQIAFETIRSDIEYTIINGVHNQATNADEANKTRGLIASVDADNIVDASSDPISLEMLKEVVQKGFENGSRLANMVIAGSPINIQRINDLLGYQPTSYSIGGVNLQQINIPAAMGLFTLLPHRYIADSKLLFVDMGAVGSVEQPVPGKGSWFIEPLAKTGATVDFMVYGKWGLAHGPDYAHLMIDNIDNS